MDRFLNPDKLCADPESSAAEKEYRHWLRTFQNFLTQVRESTEGEVDELSILVNYVSPNVYAYIEESETYANALELLQTIFSKPKNKIFARHLLATRKKREGESLDEFLQCLRQLSKDCNFKAVSAEQNREDFVGDAFVNGLLSNSIRQRLLESPTL